MEGFEFVCNFHRILLQGVATERVTASGYTPSGQDHVSSRRVYYQARSVVFAFFTRVQSLHLFAHHSMLVQLARDLGEDFYSKYWVTSVTLLSLSVNHAEFSAIEVCLLEVSMLIIGRLQYSLMALKIPCTFTRFKSILDIRSTCSFTWENSSKTVCTSICL